MRDDKEGIQNDVDRMFGLFPQLKERASQLAATLPRGERQMLAMARVISTRKLLFLDEP